MALTMMDLARKKGIEIDVEGLSTELGVPVVPVNPRKNKGITQLKKTCLTAKQNQTIVQRDFINNHQLAPKAVDTVKRIFPEISDYSSVHHLINHENFPFPDTIQEQIEQAEIDNNFNPTKTQAEEIMQRYSRISQVMQQNVVEPIRCNENYLQKNSIIFYYIVFGVMLFY